MNLNQNKINRVLVVRLRSIGDTVLATPSLIALRRALPGAEIDILLEDRVAPVLDGFEGVNVIHISRDGSKIPVIRELRRRKYDIAFNLHGGTTSTFLTYFSGAKYRVGYADYRYSRLYNVRCESSSKFWGQAKTHSAEQQLALIGHAGVDVSDRPKTHLAVTKNANDAVVERLLEHRIAAEPFALLHPATAFYTKQWPVGNFAKLADDLSERGLKVIAVGSHSESTTLTELAALANVPVITFDDLTLPEITALAARAKVFVGNDSGIAHIAAAVQTPSVVIFGSSNRDHWRPWTDAPNEIVYNEFPCQPCPGYKCEVYGEPRCILSVDVDDVVRAVSRLTKE